MNMSFWNSQLSYYVDPGFEELLTVDFIHFMGCLAITLLKIFQIIFEYKIIIKFTKI